MEDDFVIINPKPELVIKKKGVYYFPLFTIIREQFELTRDIIDGRNHCTENNIAKLCRPCVKKLIKDINKEYQFELFCYRRYKDNLYNGNHNDEIKKYIKTEMTKCYNSCQKYNKLISDIKKCKLLTKECIFCQIIKNNT